MNIADRQTRFHFGDLSKSLNHPAVTIGAVVIALVLGASQHPFVQYLRPFGDFYLALLQMCVLPFLLTTIPLAVRSAMVSGAAGAVVRGLLICIAGAVVAVALIGVLLPSLIFYFAPLDEHTIVKIGSLIGNSADRVDVVFALDLSRTPDPADSGSTGLITLIPTNIFASLSGNDSMQVLVFAAIFGIGMVATEHRLDHSVFGALRHIQAVCIQIFDWFNILVPIGIVALIAPQIARLGPDVYAVLVNFAYAFLATSFLILAAAIVLMALALRIGPATACAGMLAPIMLGAATRNSLVCIPLTLETMTEKFRIARQACDFYIPLGFATLRFGSILFFSVATLFMGVLLGRSFGIVDLVLIAALSVAASFATIGVTGIAALTPLAIVLRPFGLSYEVAVPLMIIIEPIAAMVRVMLNVAVNCLVVAIAAGRMPSTVEAAAVPAE
jgi:proton glutamate symport protein